VAKPIEATATFVKDTAKGKKHYAIEGKGVVGAVYLDAAQHKAQGEPDELKIEVSAA
jgi:hypothetical protein